MISDDDGGPARHCASKYKFYHTESALFTEEVYINQKTVCKTLNCGSENVYRVQLNRLFHIFSFLSFCFFDWKLI